MADETTNEVEEATPVEIVEEFAEAPEAVDGDSVEKAATVSEVPVDELDFVKMVDTLKTDVTASIEKNYADHAATVSDMYAAVDAIKKSIDDFGGKHSDLTNNVADVVKRLESLEKRIDAYESETAVQKSGAVENTVSDETKITKSIWQGHFLGAQSL
jgi:prefoldin subunit 5